MLKLLLIAGTKIGAKAGFILASGFILILVGVGAMADPGFDSLINAFTLVLLGFPATIISMLAGAVTGFVFAFLFSRFQHHRNIYVMVCVLFCVGVIIGFS